MSFDDVRKPSATATTVITQRRPTISTASAICT